MMNSNEMLALVKSQLSNTIKYHSDDFADTYETLIDSYNQELYGNEIEGRSQVVASDHFEMVEADMPPLARIFLGSNRILSFQPFGEHDREECREKTEYAHWIVRKQPSSFKVLFDYLKEPGFSKCAVLKYYMEETSKPEYIQYQGLTEDELALVVSDLEAGDQVSKVEVFSHEEREGERFDVEFKVVKKTKRLRVVNVPPTSFVITRGATSKDEAECVGDICTKTKGQLIAEGFDKKMVRDLPVKGTKDSVEQKRFEDQGGYDVRTGYHWTNDEVEIQNLYCLIDKDEDGVPERIFIMKCGDKILSDEPYGHVPYAIMSQILMPHALIGKSRGEYAAKAQLQHTAVERGMMDNIYSVLRPRIAVDDSAGSIDGGCVDLDDLMSDQIDGIVRVDGLPAEKLFPIVTPYIGDSALQVIQYLDSRKANALGNTQISQGLDADKFYKETATRFEGVEQIGQAKIELLARVYAETGFRMLFEGVIWTAQHFQDDACEIMVLGKPLTVDPRKWRYEHYCESAVGLGAGDSEEAIKNLGVTLQTQMQLLQMGSPLVDQKKIYNTMDDLTRALGKPDTSRYFNDPEQPKELLMAKLEQAMQMLQQLQQVAGDPYLKAEQMKAQAKLIEAQGKGQLEAARMQQNQQQFDARLQFDLQKQLQEMAAKLTDLELKYSGSNVPGSLV